MRDELSKTSNDNASASARREQEVQVARFLRAFRDENGLMLHVQTLLDSLQTNRRQVLSDLDKLTQLCHAPTEHQLGEILQCCIRPTDGKRVYSYALNLFISSWSRVKNILVNILYNLGVIHYSWVF